MSISFNHLFEGLSVSGKAGLHAKRYVHRDTTCTGSGFSHRLCDWADYYDSSLKMPRGDCCRKNGVIGYHGRGYFH